MMAVRDGHNDMVHVLLGVEGIDVNAQNKVRYYGPVLCWVNLAIDNAVGCLFLAAVMWSCGRLIPCCAELRQYGSTALMMAARNGRIQIVHMLLGFEGINVNAQDKVRYWSSVVFGSK